MSNRPTPPSARDKIQRKVKPQKSASIPPTVIVGGALIFVILLVVAVIVAAGDDLEEFVGPTPTTIPLPQMADGADLELEALLYLTEDTAFSIIAAPDNENEELVNETCAEVQVQVSDTGNFFYLDDSTEEEAYWVYARRTDDSGWNGWLPLVVLSEELPDGCESQE
jgi:hypothetical protein